MQILKSLLQLCEVSSLLVYPFRRCCANDIYGHTDGQVDSYIPTQHFVCGIYNNKTIISVYVFLSQNVDTLFVIVINRALAS